MKPFKSIKGAPNNPLEQLLCRGDVWRGHSQRFIPKLTFDTGFAPLNDALLNKGWPQSSLIEIGQQNMGGNSEWLLLTPALLSMTSGYIVLLNPPALPFAQGLLQAGISLDRLLMVKTNSKTDFLSSFVELVRTEACEAVMAWQPQQTLNYTELRKCLLAAADGKGLYVLFRHAQLLQQSSPAPLRLLTQLQPADLHVQIIKQRGLLQASQPQAIKLPLPQLWQEQPQHRLLDQTPYTKPRSSLDSET